MEIDSKTKKNIATLALILIAVLGFRFVFLMGVQKKKALSSRARETGEKIALLESITLLNKEVAGYEKALGKKVSQGAMTDRIANLSKGLDIKVLSVTPQPKDDFGEYIKLNMKLELEGLYAEVMKFLARFETEDIFIKADSIEIKSSYTQAGRVSRFYDMAQPGARRIEDKPPQVTLDISTLYKK